MPDLGLNAVQLCSTMTRPDGTADGRAVEQAVNQIVTFVNNFITGGQGQNEQGMRLRLAPQGVYQAHDLQDNDVLVDPYEGSLTHFDGDALADEQLSPLGPVLCKVISGAGPFYTVQRCSPDKATVWGKQFLAYDVNGVGPAVSDGVDVHAVRVPPTGMVFRYFVTVQTGADYETELPANVSTATASAGADADVSRGDHVHLLPLSAATPADVSLTAGAPGTSSAVPKQDHVHKLATTTTVPEDVTLTTESTGSAATTSRSDHVHRLANQGVGAYRKGIFFGSTGDAVVDYMRAF